MTADRNRNADFLTRDASRWVAQLVSGDATAADAKALERWRRASPDHEAAFVEAVRVWKNLDAGGRAFIAWEGRPAWPSRPNQMTRRFVLAGGGTLAAAAGYAMVNPPFGLWPSLDDLRADYRTATGEQRHISIADVTIQLNTQTSITVSAQGDDVDHVKLITGEASFVISPPSERSLIVLSGAGRMVASGARFDVRNHDAVVCVTCTDGQVQIEHGQHAVILVGGSQLTYDDHGLRQSRAVNAGEATAWQNGFIVFRSTSLSEAVAEINRYRPGRVILLNAALKDTPVSGRFRIERIDEVLVWIEEVTGVQAMMLPGGLVLLS
jgi:transmembrane sensor